MGLAVYVGLLWLAYRRVCADDLSRVLVLAIIVLGFSFDWLEESNFMLYTVAVIGQRHMAAALRPVAARGQAEPGSRVADRIKPARAGAVTA